MPFPPGGTLAGRKILVVEDNFLIADHLCSVLEEQGCDVVGPAPQLAQALDLVRSGQALDGAVLDINLGGQLCFPVAAALAERGVPFVFLTGYNPRGIMPSEFAARPVLSKPVDAGRLIEVARATFAARDARKDS
jgi:CheY-like chemotaxis protein